MGCQSTIYVSKLHFLNLSRFPGQTVKLSRKTATKPTSQMDTRLEVLQCNFDVIDGVSIDCLIPQNIDRKLFVAPCRWFLMKNFQFFF